MEPCHLDLGEIRGKLGGNWGKFKGFWEISGGYQRGLLGMLGRISRGDIEGCEGAYWGDFWGNFEGSMGKIGVLGEFYGDNRRETM